jgi:exodeoxyribonuclease-3
MKIITANVNGIRSAAKKGFFEWMLKQKADVVCLQETKAQRDQLTDPVFAPKGYHAYFVEAEKKGYSGVAIYCKKEPKSIETALDFHLSDSEGRFLQIDYANVSVVSLYLPSGSSGEERQKMKYHFMEEFEKYLKASQKKKREFVLCGDWNIVHKQIDIKNWASNQKTSGCLPEERAWLDKVFGQWKWVDAFRVVNQEPHQYTWWSNRGQAWANNVGWRIDYQIVTPGLGSVVKSASIYKEQRFADHAPLIIEYDFEIK